MEVGCYTYGAEKIELRFSDMGYKVYIGKFCSIAHCKIFLGGNHNTRMITTYPFGLIHQGIFPHHGLNGNISNGNVYIGNDVWIGENATIMSGIKIGDGAVIAANSHVIKNVDPYSIVGGNPATLIRYRFSQQEIQKLLELAWWDYSNDKINEIIPLLTGSILDLEALEQKLKS